MFISFLLARKFRGKVYILSMLVVLVLVSLFSIGFPSVGVKRDWEVYELWRPNLPAIPLSFPFYFCISVFSPLNYRPPPLFPTMYDVKLYFFGVQIGNVDHILLTTGYIILLTSFFLLTNLVGAIFGYWISKTTFIGKLLKKDKSNHVV